MGKQQPSNENIRIGSIFSCRYSGECGSSSGYYQVVGLRGKTLVELRPIRTEEYVDGRCVKSEEEQRRFQLENPGEECTPTTWDWLVWSRPLPGQFDGETFTVRALKPDADGTNWLQGRGGYEHWDYYHEVAEDDESMIVGDSGAYARKELKKKGKLPSWAALHQP